MKAVILAGGKGTRLGNLALDLPKPLVKICDTPILEHQIRLLKREGITDIILLTGHLGHKIQDYFGGGEKFGVQIQCIQEEAPLGTAGCLTALKGKIQEDFLLLYGDVILDMDFGLLAKFHQKKGAFATLVAHPNDHPYDSDLIKSNDNEEITGFFLKKEHKGKDCDNLVNAAIYVLSSSIFDYIPSQECDFIQDIFPKVLQDGKPLYAYQTTEYMKDVGTPDRLNLVAEHIKQGLVSKRNLRNSQKAIFLDRDGTINEEVNLLSSVDQMRLLSLVSKAVQKINRSEYLAVCVTNQPVIARNLCSLDELNHIHQRMQTLLGEKRAYLDRIYHCPHHPDRGYPEERAEYKIDCVCRKPGTGMLEDASRDMNINLSESYIIGDRTVDIQTGKAAGLKTILVRTGIAGQDRKYDVKSDHVFDNLLEAVNFVLESK
jgi:mannose-1-phosphate guanylyltransferase / phosphomannomutase